MASKRKTKPTEPLRLDLGCGQGKLEGWIGVDIVRTPAVDVVADLFKFPWPWADATVDEIRASHFIEHVPWTVKGDERDGLIVFMDECWRILKPDAKMTVIAPYYASHRWAQDPTHRRPVAEQTFLYFNADWRKQQRLDHYPIKSNFNFVYGYGLMPEWQARNDEARAFALRQYINVAADLHVTLTKLP